MEDLPVTFGVLDALKIERAHITSLRNSAGELPEDDSPAWNASTSYTERQLAHRVETGMVYTCVSPGADATPPEDNPTKWKATRPTNRQAAFDLYRNTQTVGDAQLVAVFRPGEYVTDLWLAMVATKLTVTITDGVGGPVVYGPEAFALDGAGVQDWQAFFLAPVRLQPETYLHKLPLVADPVITVQLDHPGGQAKLGHIQMGRFIGLGTTEYGAEFAVISHSFKKFEADGTYTYIKRPAGGQISAPVYIQAADVPLVHDTLHRYESVPALWAFHTGPQFSPLRAFGVLEGRVRYDSYGRITLNGTLEGIN